MKRISVYVLLFVILIASASCGPALEKRKEDSAIHYRMGVIHLNDRNYADALKELTEAVKIYPDDPSYHNALGLAYFARGMNADAIREMKTAVELDPKFSEAHVNLSAVYINEREFDKSIASSREALKNIFYRSPETAYHNVGWAYFYKDDFAASIDAFKKAVETRPNYAIGWYGLGNALEKSGNVKAAIDAYEKAVRAAPDYLDAYYSLGLLHLKSKNNASALKAFETVRELAPDGEKGISASDYIKLLK